MNTWGGKLMFVWKDVVHGSKCVQPKEQGSCV
jgi:hypothetical protein